MPVWKVGPAGILGMHAFINACSKTSVLCNSITVKVGIIGPTTGIAVSFFLETPIRKLRGHGDPSALR